MTKYFSDKQANSKAESVASTRQSKYDYIIWDWNGTLYNDVMLGYKTVNEMLTERGYDALSLEKYKDIFSFPIVDYYRKAGFNFDIESYESLANVFISKYKQRMDMDTALYPDAISVLDAAGKLGVRQVILSASRADMLHKQVEDLGISHFFSEILGRKDIYADGKAEIAAKWLASLGEAENKLLMIGDTEHDYEIASILGADCILISNGHQSHHRLAKRTTTLTSLKDILTYL